MGPFYTTTCKTDCLQLLHKFCKNWISVTNIVHQLTLSLSCNHWNVPIKSIFDGFWGTWTPKCRRPSCEPPKGTSLRYNAYCETLFVEICQRVTAVGEPGKDWCYISRIWPGAPLCPISTNFGLGVCLVDIVNCAKFYRNKLKCLDSVRGRNLTIRIGLRCHR